MGNSARRLAVLILPIVLAGCAGGGDEDARPISFTGDRSGANQPFPANYRAELLAFM